MAKPALKLVDETGKSARSVPEHLGPVGARWWTERVAQLEAAGITGQVDLSLVEQAAEMYEGRRDAQEAVKKHGQMVKGRTGMKKNPAVAKHLEYGREFRQIMKQLARQIEDAVPETDERDSAFSFG